MEISIERIQRIIPRLKYEGKAAIYQFKYLLREKCGIAGRQEKYSANYLRTKINRVFVKDNKSGFERIGNNTVLYEDIIRAADYTLKDNFYVLHNYYDNIRRSDGHYKWNTDIFSGFTYFIKYKKYYTNTVFNSYKKDHQDLKGPWELSRLQYIVAPAIAWNLTGNNDYAKKVIKILSDWIEVNNLDEGPNWNCTMEAGIRVVNMLLALQLIVDYQGISDKFATSFILSIKDHLYFILWNLENYAGRTYNHYLGDIIGIIAIVTSCPFLPNTKRLYRKFKMEFEYQIRRQVLPDGGDFEGSTCYHCLVGEMFALAAMLVENYGDRFSEKYYQSLQGMADFSISLRKVGNGNQPQIGDNDSGRIIEILSHTPRNYDWFINIAFYITKRKYYSKYYADLLSFMMGCAEVDSSSDTKDISFPDFGLVGYRDENVYILLSGTEVQKHGLGGHTHNDKLSLELSYKGVDFITDPGSGVYTSDKEKHNRLRSVVSHSTVIVDENEQNEGQIIGFFGNSYDCKSTVRMEKTDKRNCTLKGKCEVRNNKGCYTHIRNIRINDKHIVIEDKIEANTKKNISINFVLAPDVEVEIISYNAILRSKGIEMRINCNNDWKVGKAYFSPSYGKLVESNRLFAMVEANAGNNTIISAIDLR